MNTYLGGYGGTDGGSGFSSSYRLFLKTTDLAAPGPAKTFVFLEERWDAMLPSDFYTPMTGYPNQPSQYTLYDYPNFVHDLGCSFSFGDGHGEIHRWRDSRTTPPLGSILSRWGGLYGTGTAVPRDLDVAWLQDHATRPR